MKAHGEPAAKTAAPAVPSPESRPTSPANPLWSRLACGGGWLQPRLRVGAVDDPLEREADRVAEAVVVGAPAPSLSGGAAGSPAGAVQRACAACRDEEEKLQAKPAAGAVPGVSPRTEARIGALRGGGAALSPAIRGYFEPRFGRDFSTVRLHDGGAAAAAAGEVGARAFTVGQDIAFGAGELRPDTAEGRKLLAHELTHTVQQGGGGEPRVQRVPADLDFKALAQQIFDAIDGPGTDEEAVYRALQQLGRDPAAIARLEETYRAEHQLDLRQDIEGDFSEEELEYALQLLSSGQAESEQRIERGPNAVVSTATAIERLWAAVDIVGTDEEAIFATLLPYNRHTAELQEAFEKRYGENLRARIISEMSESELDYALELLGPEGETKKVEDLLSPQVIERNFPAADHDLARKILRDLLAVRGDRLDFASEPELVDEIRKRLRTGQLMQESQTGTAFGYPESLPPECPGYTADRFLRGSKHARVNKAASALWSGPDLDPQYFYIFRLTPEGRTNAFDAVTKLFTPQASFCDRTLIHCDFLIEVIHYRAFAESLGRERFNALVSAGRLEPVLTYTGFPKPPEDPGKAPQAWSLQQVRPASEDDLVIGDHVIFWNHLAYDAITQKLPGPWRLENALLVDKSPSGEDLYEGHGAPEVAPNVVTPGTKDQVLHDLVKVYNSLASRALALTREVDRGADPNRATELANTFPRVVKDPDQGWILRELDDRAENARRRRRWYPLRELSGTTDPELVGLRDPDDQTRMSTVKRPVESAQGLAPKP